MRPARTNKIEYTLNNKRRTWTKFKNTAKEAEAALRELQAKVATISNHKHPKNPETSPGPIDTTLTTTLNNL